MMLCETSQVMSLRKGGDCPSLTGCSPGIGEDAACALIVVFSVIALNFCDRYAVAAAVLGQMSYKQAMLHKAAVTEAC